MNRPIKLRVALIVLFSVLIVAIGVLLYEFQMTFPWAIANQTSNATSTGNVLIPSNWLTYHNDNFSFSFSYPSQATICEYPQLYDTVNNLDLGISIEGSCNTLDQYGASLADIFIYIQGAQMAPDKNLANDFYTNFGIIDRSLNPNLGYLNVDGLTGYGGIVRRANTQGLEYIIYINQGGHNISIWDRHYDAHEEDTNLIINSLHFDSRIYNSTQ
jgi:hypothetical protein